MTRKSFFKGLITSLLPLTAFGVKKQRVCFPVENIWQTPQGQYVKMLRAELERLGHWDDLPEDWQSTEEALKNGHLFFDITPSREENKRLLYNVRPVFYEKQIMFDDKDRQYLSKQLL